MSFNDDHRRTSGGLRLPSQDPRDPDYRRLRYSRYADDTLLGFAGPKAEAEEIKQRLAVFLRDDLKLELSPDKTLITHARTQRARFLGYEIATASSNCRTRRPSVSDRRNRRWPTRSSTRSGPVGCSPARGYRPPGHSPPISASRGVVVDAYAQLAAEGFFTKIPRFRHPRRSDLPAVTSRAHCAADADPGTGRHRQVRPARGPARPVAVPASQVGGRYPGRGARSRRWRPRL